MSLNTRLFVGNVPDIINDTALREAFSSYGNIINLEIKTKPGAENDRKRFAFITLQASNYDVESCIKNISNVDFEGHKLYVTRARESFLERLQREREQVSKKEEEKNVQCDNLGSFPMENPVINLSAKLYPQKRKLDVYNDNHSNNSNKNAKVYEKEKEVISDFQQHNNRAFIENCEVYGQNDKKQESDKKRLESLKKKRQEFKEKKMIIKTGLGGIDNVQNKKVIFSDNEDSYHDNFSSTNHQSMAEKEINGKKSTLFDEDDSDTEVNFEIKKQFEGKRGQKILDLQSRYKSDKRFMIDERFIDEDQSDNQKEHELAIMDNEGIDLGQSDEKLKQLHILQDVLGVSIKTNNSDSAQKTKPKLGMRRYDPMQPDHAKFLAPAVIQEVTKKLKKKNSKEVQAASASESIVEKVEVSKEQFYKVSETLKEAMTQPSSFSLRNLFSKEGNDDKEQEEQNVGHISIINEKERKSKNPLNPGEKNPFVYDSSDSEVEENKEETNVSQEKSETKAVWREKFFFSENDYRLKEGLFFFNKHGENEEPKERRGLKSIMKKRIYNKERKNQMFQKKIGGRKKSMKKSTRNKR